MFSKKTNKISFFISVDGGQTGFMFVCFFNGVNNYLKML